MVGAIEFGGQILAPDGLLIHDFFRIFINAVPFSPESKLHVMARVLLQLFAYQRSRGKFASLAQCAVPIESACQLIARSLYRLVVFSSLWHIACTNGPA
jgi:hypothetical protein